MVIINSLNGNTVNDELRRWKEATAQFKILTHYLPGGTKEKL
jgi:hypothetical protein